MRSTQKVSCQDVAMYTLWTLSVFLPDGRGWGAVHCRLDRPVMFGSCVSGASGELLQLMCLLISADRKTEILPHRFAYLHWKCKLGKGHRIIYTYGPHTAFSFHSWCFPVPHRSSHYAMVFAGILVVSQKSPASFLNLHLAISWSFSDRDELGFSFLNIKFEECIWTPAPSCLYWLDIRLNDASSIAEGSVRAVLECSG